MHDIALDLTNEAGGYNFFSLETGKRIYSSAWEKVPVTDDVIKVVELWEKMNLWSRTH